MCNQQASSPRFKEISNADRILFAGFIGCAIMLLVAYAQPAALNEFQLNDLSPAGIMAKLGALMAAGGLLAFLYGIPESLTESRRNALRLLYTVGFIAASFCSESDWQCFA